MQADGFVCQSFSHKLVKLTYSYTNLWLYNSYFTIFSEIEQICVLNERTKNDNSTILESDKDWNYYEIDNALCIGKFICDNGNCIDKSKVLHFKFKFLTFIINCEYYFCLTY